MTTLRVPITWRELQQIDLDHLDWAGDAVHLAAMRQVLHDSWTGDAVALVGELPTGVLVAHGVIDFRGSAHHAGRPDDAGWLWNLSVRESWQGLGLGTLLINRLEKRAGKAGFTRVALAVEADNLRARALYLRCGYTVIGLIDEPDAYSNEVAQNTLMVREISGRTDRPR